MPKSNYSMTKLRQQGLTLVELMVSMVIGLIILSGIVTVVLTSHNSFRTETEGSFIQENARYAFNMLARDIRLAGNLGCADLQYTYVSNVIDVTPTDPYGGLFSLTPIEGYEGNVEGTAPDGTPITAPDDYVTALSDATSSDAIVLRYANPEAKVVVKNYVPGAKKFNFFSGKTHNFKAGDNLIVVDTSCRNAGLFSNTSTSDTQLLHDGGVNCSNNLYSRLDESLDCDKANTASLVSYSNGSEVMEYVVHAYYVADSTTLPGTPALKRKVLTASGYRTEELAQGVESLEVKYGVDLKDEGFVSAYLDADKVDDWAAVKAVRAELIFRSQSEIFPEAQTVTISDTVYNDRYLRQMAAATIKIRNR